MTLLGTGLFFGESTNNATDGNAAPSITTLTLNFDFTTLRPPVGQNQAFIFEVLPQNQAPDAQNQQFVFDVIAS